MTVVFSVSKFLVFVLSSSSKEREAQEAPSDADLIIQGARKPFCTGRPLAGHDSGFISHDANSVLGDAAQLSLKHSGRAGEGGGSVKEGAEVVRLGSESLAEAEPLITQAEPLITPAPAAESTSKRRRETMGSAAVPQQGSFARPNGRCPSTAIGWDGKHCRWAYGSRALPSQGGRRGGGADARKRKRRGR